MQCSLIIMKFPLILIVFKLFIFGHCENITTTKSIQKITPKILTNDAPAKVPNVNFSQQNKSEPSLKSVNISEADLDDSLNDSLGDIDPLLNEKSKDFDWKDPQFKSFSFDRKHDNASLEKLLNILTPLINLTRLDNDTKAFDWSDEELDADEDLFSTEDEDLTSFDLQVGTFIQKISPNYKLKSLEPTLKVAPKEVSPSKNSSEQAPVESKTLQLNVSEEAVTASSDVDEEVMLGEPSSPVLYRIPRAASDSLHKRTPITPLEPFISRRFSVNSLRELMDYYEPLRLPGLEELNITLSCQKDMALYIEALNKRIPWALKSKCWITADYL